MKKYKFIKISADNKAFIDVTMININTHQSTAEKINREVMDYLSRDPSNHIYLVSDNRARIKPQIAAQIVVGNGQIVDFPKRVIGMGLHSIDIENLLFHIYQ